MPMISESTPITFADPLPDAVDVAVIGAGVVGTSTAWFLARQGAKVALIEKGRVAGEQSSRNWGWVRQQGRDRDELPIMMESNRIWRGLAEETGEQDLEFTAAGCVYLAEDERALARFEQWHDLAKEHQLDTRMLSAEEARATAPGVEGQWVGGMLTPSDGRAEPFVAVPALARAARGAGVSVTEHCAIRTVETANGQVRGVHTERGPVRADRVVLAGGAWSTYFAANAGLDLPQLVVRSTVARTRPAPDRGLPNVSAPGFTMRRRTDGGYSVSTGDVAEHYLCARSFRDLTKFLPLMKQSARDLRLRPKPPADYPGAWGSKSRWSAGEVTPFERMRVLDPPPSPEVDRRLRDRLPKRVPWLAEAGIAEIWAGMIDVTPDAVPYLCEAPALPGLFIGTGMSGHGFGIGPGVGRVLADLVLGRPTGFDLSRFRFGRFADGSPIVPGPY
ncbi:MAG: FAD-binding oxidoreductase [Thiotrichales bacterium]|nr:FAD-binding oxidoreductase [Thiotrichales bacterium]